jgi:hypothetical protein
MLTKTLLQQKQPSTKQGKRDVVLLKRKALITALILVLLFSAMVRVQLRPLAKANFVFPPADPVINMESPANRTYSINTLPLEVTFYTYKTGYYGAPEDESLRLFTYTVDSKNPEPITITNSSVALNPGGDVFFEGSVYLPELSEGLHSLTARVVFDYTDLDSPWGNGEEHYRYHTESESTVHFRIDTVPQNISILMPENSTYMLEVPLQFFIDEPASWIGCSLDGQENVTVTGNTTLPFPSAGQHTLMLYAKDAYGNPVASGTITFSVADPLPILLVVVAVSAAAVGGLIFFKKRKR